jgi:hypothetical protein
VVLEPSFFPWWLIRESGIRLVFRRVFSARKYAEFCLPLCIFCFFSPVKGVVSSSFCGSLLHCAAVLFLFFLFPAVFSGSGPVFGCFLRGFLFLRRLCWLDNILAVKKESS